MLDRLQRPGGAGTLPVMSADLDGSMIAPDARSLAEVLAERLDAGRGAWTLEFVFEDGRLRRVHRHETLVPASLERFDSELGAARSG